MSTVATTKAPSAQPRQPFIYITLLTLGAILVLYGLSFVGYSMPYVSTFLWWGIVVATAIISWRKPTLGLALVFGELLIGQKGYLFSYAFAGNIVSLRIGMFLAFFVGWTLSVIFAKQKLNDLRLLVRHTPFFWPLHLLAVLVLIGGIHGLATNPASLVIADGNAWLYFFLIIPLLALVQKKSTLYRFAPYVVGCVLTLTLLTFGFSAGYSTLGSSIGSDAITISERATTADAASLAVRGITRVGVAWNMYRWQNDLGLGEIAYLGNHVFRYFAGGQLYVALAAVGLAYGALRAQQSTQEKTATYHYKNLLVWGGLFFLILAVVVSWSRSLWLGCAAGLLAILTCIPRRRAIALVGVLCALVLATWIAYDTHILPPAIRNRITISQTPTPAAQNRINLLQTVREKIQAQPLLGSGFGTTVTYLSVAPEKYGYIKVFAYEWGWLDIATKIGIMGAVVYAWLLATPIWMVRRAKNSTTQQEMIAWSLGFLVLAATNITTPFLNHPLGIGYVLVAITALTILHHHDE